MATSSIQIRMARPTDKFREVLAFYRDALGLPVIMQFENHAGYSGVILSTPTSLFHLEFTHTEAGSPCPAPTKDNLLVFYLPDNLLFRNAIRRLEEHGYQPVEPDNPYWKDSSLTFEDPDGWRVVIFNGPSFGGVSLP